MSLSAPELQRHDNGFWYVHWTAGRRSKRTSTRAKDLGEAKAFFSEWLKLEAQPADETAAQLTVAEVWAVFTAQHWVGAPASRNSSWLNLKPHFGERLISELDDELVEEYLDKRAAGDIGRANAKSGTLRRELCALQTCLNWAGRKKKKGRGKKGGGGLLLPSQVPLFDLPEPGPPRDRWLSDAELRLMFEAIEGDRHGATLTPGEIFVWLALETASRKTAILELTWTRVDFETNVVHYDRPGRAETNKRRADVPISKTLRPILERAYRERAGDLVVGRFDAYGYVTKIARYAGLVGVSPQILRHTAASHMARRGVPLWIVAKILGDTLATVEKVYAKHCPDDLRPGIEMISRGWLEAAA